jgi:circadian clock protein KaiB
MIGSSRLLFHLSCPGVGNPCAVAPIWQILPVSGGPLPEYILRLYVTGSSPKAAAAISNLRRICDEELRGQYDLQIVDVLEHPQAAEDDRVLATPTLIKRLPLPLRRVIGDLSDKHKVLLGLEVRPDGINPNA